MARIEATCPNIGTANTKNIILTVNVVVESILALYPTNVNTPPTIAVERANASLRKYQYHCLV